eukprot:Nitzschia sp. Nitz4//scaffold118_size93875//65968//66381//NITZ4_004794-RA/size93875-processed-gene-0.63-mRNA-1//-1//CDS//3329533742//5813//frame0
MKTPVKTTMPITILKPETIGEELYLVHLQRRRTNGTRGEDEEDDIDRPTPSTLENEILLNKKRSPSCGEELWEIHLKRSRGMPLEKDELMDEETGGVGGDSSSTMPPTDQVQPHPSAKSPPPEHHHYYLRDRKARHV